MENTISIWRNGKGMKKWTACVNGVTDNVTGKTPEDAISKLNEEYPDTVDLPVTYVMNTAAEHDHGGDKTQICKVCGKPVEFYRVVRETLVAVHVGDPKPKGAVDEKPEIPWAKQNSLRRGLQNKKHAGIAKAFDEDIGEAAEDAAIPEVEPEVVVVPAAITKLLETPAIPKEKQVLGAKPQLDISDCKRNKFAIVGAIVRKMNEAGIDKPKVDSIRSELMAKGNFEHMVQIASPYVQIVENGLVLGQAA